MTSASLSEYEQRVRRFLQEPVPPGGTPQWKQWKQDFRDFGDQCVPILLDALENGTEDEQYAAVLGLRFFGYYASADGYGKDLIFEIKEPGASEMRIIKPKITPKDPGHSDDEAE